MGAGIGESREDKIKAMEDMVNKYDTDGQAEPEKTSKVGSILKGVKDAAQITKDKVAQAKSELETKQKLQAKKGASYIKALKSLRDAK